jgi:glutamate 5-kinase
MRKGAPPARPLTEVPTLPPRALGDVRRLVVKVGSGVIATRGRLRPKIVADLVYDVTVLRHRGCEVIMVVSGAVASGFQSLGLSRPPTAVLPRQAAAAIGQHKMMAMFARLFAKHRTEVGQLLMSADDIENRQRFLSARHTLLELLARGVVPIINENDALSDHQAIIGDNDHLSALVTNVASAQLLIILSRVAGLLEGGLSGTVIPRVEVDSDVARHIRRELSESGVGGMVAKVSAARLAANWGVPTVIADGTQPGQLLRIMAGEEIGTMFVPREPKLSARKRWIAFRTRSRGVLVIDAGARRALCERGASLLASGVRAVEGDFPMGSRVDIVDEERNVLAIGLVSYAADEIRRLCGRREAEIKSLLGYEYVKEIVHRDELVLLAP